MLYIQEGDSALMEAARVGKTGVVKELVKGGTDLNLQNNVCQSHSTIVLIGIAMVYLDWKPYKVFITFTFSLLPTVLLLT